MPKIYATSYKSPLGKLHLLADEDSLLGVWLNEQKNFLGNYQKATVVYFTNEVLLSAKQWLDAYFAGKQPKNFRKIKLQASPFTITVWQTLLEIDYAMTISYQQLGKQVASKLAKKQMSAQAIGSAVGRNPFLILLPCHRVIQANGQIGQYVAGHAKKQWLLAHEKKTKL